MSDGLRAHIRTYVPIAIGFLATLLVRFLAEKVGVQINGELAIGLVTAAMTMLVYSAGRWLEKQPNTVLAFVGRFLLSLGADLGQPKYTEPSVAVKTRTGPPPPLRYGG